MALDGRTKLNFVNRDQPSTSTLTSHRRTRRNWRFNMRGRNLGDRAHGSQNEQEDGRSSVLHLRLQVRPRPMVDRALAQFTDAGNGRFRALARGSASHPFAPLAADVCFRPKAAICFRSIAAA